MESNPFIAAPMLNKRARYGAGYYQQRLIEKFEAVKKAGVVGIDRQPTLQAKLDTIAYRLPLLQAVVLDPRRHQGQRERAQKEIMQYYKLQQKLYGS